MDFYYYYYDVGALIWVLDAMDYDHDLQDRLWPSLKPGWQMESLTLVI